MIVSVLLCFLIPLQAFSNPIDIHLQNETVTSGQNLQFEAENSITADSNYFIKSGANVIMKAKKNTILLPEVWAEDGSRLHILFPPPVVSFTADRTAVPKGESATLSWSIQCADDMTITHIGDVESEGTITVSPTETTTYEVIAKGPSGTATATLTINIFIPPPIITLKALKTSIGLFESTTLVWTTRFADDAVISSDIGSVPINGEMVVFPKNTTTYTLTATGVSGTTSTSVTINHPPTRYAENGQSIQNQINNSSSGDIIVVGDGTYPETLDFGGKALRVISRNGPEKSTIDPGENGSGVIFNHNEGENAILEGFTIQNGLADNGGGIQVIGASPTIRNCIVTGNTAQENGGGIYIENGSPRIENTLVVKNTATGNGGGFYLTSAPAVEIVNCTTAFNMSSDSGSDFYAVSSNAVITNAIFWSIDGKGFYKDDDSDIRAEYSNIRYFTSVYLGSGNINQDPKFRGTEDYKLHPLSPSINTGSLDNMVPKDLAGIARPVDGTPEMGAYECRATKTLFVGLEGVEYTAIQDAIDDAFDGETIMVKDGVFTGERNRNLDFKGKAITLKSENGFEHCIIDCESKGRGFIFKSGEQNTSQLIGFTIVRGNPFNYETNQPGNGGGIYVGPGCSPKFLDIKVFGCNGDISLNKPSIESGGGLYVSGQNANPTFEFCSFAVNGRATTTINNDETPFRIPKGGGIYFGEGASPTLDSCRILSNTAEFGGGMFSHQANPTLTNCQISNNYANADWYNDGLGHVGLHGSGGGVYAVNWSSVRLEGCAIHSNNSTREGGGLFLNGAITISKTKIHHNGSRTGGGIYVSSGDLTMMNSLIYSNESRPTSAISEYDTGYMKGGAVYLSETSYTQIFNCTITDNTCRPGNYGGVYCNGAGPAGLSIINSIIWGNAQKVTIYMGYTNEYIVPDNVLENRVYGDILNGQGITVTPNIQTSFVNNLNGLSTGDNFEDDDSQYQRINGHPGFYDNSYLLSPVSVEKGLVNSGTEIGLGDDIEGNPRVNGMDMGCFETPADMVGPIQILEQPLESSFNRTVTRSLDDARVILQVSATPFVTYQWYRNGQKLTGATSATYTTQDINAYGVYRYKCLLHIPDTPYGVFTTAACVIVNPIEIDEHPVSKFVTEGTDVEFSGKISGVSQATDIQVTWYMKRTNGEVSTLPSTFLRYDDNTATTSCTIDNVDYTQHHNATIWFEVRLAGASVAKSLVAMLAIDFIDVNNNKIPDSVEITIFGKLLTSDELKEDPDGDYITNEQEVIMMSQGLVVNPFIKDKGLDSDGDGATNYLEHLAGTDAVDPDDKPEKGSYYAYDELGRMVETVIAR